MPSYFAYLLLYLPFRFITPEDEQWFNIHLVRALEENISPDVASYILPEPYFVDFLREMPEPTGDEPEDTVFEVPKIYELVSIFTFEKHFSITHLTIYFSPPQSPTMLQLLRYMLIHVIIHKVKYFSKI